ncbi:MAG: hypothetical protein LCH32_00140 [Bacteroidetes bacterium]|nr:hypothetical protein [Bacteroidota bacterium]
MQANEIVKVSIIENKIIELNFLQENITLTVEQVKLGWDYAKEISPTKSLNVLVKTGKWTLLEKDARDYVMNEFKLWPKVAVIVSNFGQKIMGQIIINLTGNKQKIKLFDNETKAIDWLKTN